MTGASLAPKRCTALLLAVLAAVLWAGWQVAGGRATPGVRLRLAPREATPGQWVMVRVEGAKAHRLAGEWAGRSFPFYDDGAQGAVALVAVSYFVQPGKHPLVVREDGKEVAAAEVPVRPRAFPVQRLRVDPGKEALIRPQDPADVARRRREDEEVARARSRSNPRPLWQGPFVWPLARPYRLTSEFGLVREVNGAPSGRHSGLDLAAPEGTPVHAPNGGRVVLARDHLATGKTVILDHGWGLFTSYLHLSSIRVREGAFVSKGEILGTVGATGFATGPHLHWAAYLPGGYVDPRSLMERWPPESSSPGS
ncbi:M23 family metallopeptidase [Carboxydochorda subterranea]|uniref:M23 family metallopeptidase n=1 Tax=Carboxydichorda subterranea TaxID=3109565 RepID=A0ABZ1C1D9_9FIRM|nr:M23 family metallopeptidase [Limnochorda sp. L945t]WRP18909.1 M23 family metallopeptidase [Limnochorda sp. L945t]